MKVLFILLVALVLFGGLPLYVHAEVYISEIMHDPEGSDTGREWVEVYNDSTQTFDMTNWKFFEANTNHRLTPIQGSGRLSGGEYGIIADNPEKFKTDYPSYSGLLFDSAFSLLNTGEVLVLKNENDESVSIVTYSWESDVPANGLSLNRSSNGDWVARVASPGFSMSSETESSDSSDNDDDNAHDSSESESSSHSSALTVTKASPKNIKVSAGRDRLGMPGSPLIFEAYVDGQIAIRRSNYEWSFGDGTSAFGPVVEHVYRFPGKYNIVLNVYGSKDRGVSRARATIIEPRIVIGEEAGYMKVTNESSDEINLGSWSVTDSQVRSILPIDTIIGAGSSVVLPFKKSIATSSLSLVSPNSLIRYTSAGLGS